MGNPPPHNLPTKVIVDRMKVIDETGNVYGKLTVIEQKKSRNGQARWRCQCECGKETDVAGGELRAGNSRSCGCQWGLYKRIDSDYDADFNRYFRNLKRGAANREYEFSLTREQVYPLIQQDCTYCGVSPIKRNGLDRVDNEKGYTLDNIVPCCEDCNRAKLTRTAEEFLSWAERVVRYNL